MRSFSVVTAVVIAIFISSTTALADDEYLMGEVKAFAGNFAPRNWASAEGQLLAISSNTALFSILGTVYGGDGRTTFGLPDLRGRSIVGQGQGIGLSTRRRLGEQIGSERATLPSVGLSAAGGDTAVAVGEQSIDVQSPALAMTQIICILGRYPSRS